MMSEMEMNKVLEACTVAFLVYQIGTLITTGSLGSGFVPGLIAVAVMVAVVVALIARTNWKFSAEYKLKVN